MKTLNRVLKDKVSFSLGISFFSFHFGFLVVFGLFVFFFFFLNVGVSFTVLSLHFYVVLIYRFAVNRAIASQFYFTRLVKC